VEALREHGFQVSVFDIRQTYYDVAYYLGDIRDESQLAIAFEKVVPSSLLCSLALAEFRSCSPRQRA
jgi:hypothetical protein